MTKRARLVLIISLLLIAIAASILITIGDRSGPAPATTNTTPKTSQPSDTSVAPPVPKSYAVKVYFSKHPESDNDPTKVFAVRRTSPDLGVARFSLQQLLKGPTQSESAAGYFTDVRVRNDASTCGNDDFTLTISNTKATVRFCRTFDAVGVLSDARANETIRATLLQFPAIKSVVVVSKTGHCQFDLSGEDHCLVQ